MNRHYFLTSLLPASCVSVLLFCVGCAALGEDDAAQVSAVDQGLTLQTVASGLDDPWGMDFLPDGTVLVTELSGELHRVWPDSGRTVEIEGVPESERVGQGGMLDVLVDPDFRSDPWIYLSYAVKVNEGYTTRVTRLRLQDNRLADGEVLFTAEPAYGTRRHFGSRLLRDQDYLYLTVGDRGRRQGAQDLSVHNGKLIRLHADGSVPEDNPFVGEPEARPEIYSYGHRNPQGLARHPLNGEIWLAEHGPQGGDEINRIKAGANYGWPVITYGEEYGGGKIGVGTHREGMEQPLKYYVPSIGAAGMTFYDGNVYGNWKPSVLLAALRMTHINRVELIEEGLGTESRLFTEARLRVRDLQQGPDGHIYALVGSGQLVKILAGG